MLLTELSKAGHFDSVVDPGQVKAQMAQNDKLVQAIVDFRTKWVATGISDKNAVAYIVKTFNVESIIFGEVSQWGTQSFRLKKFTRAGLTMRWVDSGSGEMLWKASHTIQEEQSLMFLAVMGGGDPALGTMKEVIGMIVAAWPKKK